ncbi:MAG: hotdog fold thioesterase [Deltaproteobacteria bacterium]|nr:hotdog fold thioesterase [Deltaproteobacteria bacterium]MBW2218824.1 hotdog fold thioesterase [Deltaproteobacteria bacterium]
MNTLEKMTENDKFAKHVGVRLLEVSKGYAKAELTIDERHLNGLGIAHGGAIFTLADLVFAAASNSRGTDAVAININISYFKAEREGRLTAEANEISLNHKLATYSIFVFNEAGEKIAAMQGTAFRKSLRQ